MQIFRTIGNYFSTHKRQILSFLFFAVFFFFAFDSVWAAEDAASTTNQATQSNQSSNGIAWINTIFKGIAVLLAIMTNLIGLFLYPEWTSGSAIGLDKAVHELWILVSNVVYFIFAFIFVWVAFMNIIGKDGDTFQLQKAIPRFIIGILIVPFSWFFVQFLISVSSVLTAAVLSLPLESLKTYMEENEEGYKFPYCESGYTVDTTQGPTASPNDVVKCKDGAKPVNKSLEDVMLGKNGDGAGIYSIMYVYTYGVMRFDDAQKLFRNDVSSVTALIDLIFKSGFSIIFIFVYALLVIALGLALFVRGVYLWIFSMFSPVFGLLFFFKKSGGDGVLKLFTLKEFVALAMVPVYVSAALVFGLLFLAVAGKGLSQEDTTTNANRATITQEDGNKSCLSFTDHEVCWAGVYNSENSDQSIFGGFKGAIGGLIAEVFGIVFLWLAVMTALNQSTITKEVIAPISQFGESIGKLIRESPKYAPIIPTPGGMLSANQFQAATGQVMNDFTSKFQREGQQFGTKISDALNLRNDSTEGKIKDLVTVSKNTLNNQVGTQDFLQKLATTSGSIDTLVRDNRGKQAFVDALKEAGFKDDAMLKNLKDQTSPTEFIRSLHKIAYESDLTKTSDNLNKSFHQLQWNMLSSLQAAFGLSSNGTQIPPPPPPVAATRPNQIQIINNNLTNTPEKFEIGHLNGANPTREPVTISTTNGINSVDKVKLLDVMKNQGYGNGITEAELRKTLQDVHIVDNNIEDVVNHFKGQNFAFKQNPPTP